MVENGAKVALFDLDEAALNAAQEALCVDATDAESLKAGFAEVAQKRGGRLKEAESCAPFERTAPLGKIARTEDLYAAALLFASPASSHVTGAEIIIDGGTCLGPDRPA